MTKNPVLNALTATGYIVLVVSIISLLSHTHSNKPDTFLAPILVLSLFTFSAIVMASIFLYQPIQLYLEGKKKKAVSLFVQTMGVFAGITFLILFLLFSGVIK